MEYARLTGSLAECVCWGEGVKNRTWSVMTTSFSLRLCSSGEKTGLDVWRRGMTEFNFDLAEFTFHQPSRIYKMRIPEGQTGIPGKGKHIACSARFCTYTLHIAFSA